MKNQESPVDENKKDGGLADTSNYEPPISPVKIPDNDTGFKTVKKAYRRFIWTLDQHSGKKNKGKDK
jgi:hypothetical protein